MHTSRFSPTLWSLYILGFFSASSFALVIPSIFFFMLQLQLNTKFYGLVVGSFSFGQLLGSVPIGFLASKFGTKLALLLCLIVNITGFVMYAFATTLPMLIISRVIAGLGTGYITVIRGYIGQACAKEISASVSGYVTMGQLIGYALGPTVFATIFTPVHIEVGSYVINANTGPPLVSALLKLLAVLMVIFVFKPISPGDQQSKSPDGNIQQPLLCPSDDEMAVEVEKINTTNPAILSGDGVGAGVAQSTTSPWPGLVIIAWLYFIDIGIFSGFETNISPLVKHQYNWGTLESNLFTGSAGVTALLYVLAIDFCVRRFGWSDALVWSLCMGGLILGSLFLLSPPHLAMPLVSLILAVLAYPIAGAGISVLYNMYATIGRAYQMDHQKITGVMVLSGALGRLVGPVYAAFAFHFPGDDNAPVPPSPSHFNITYDQPVPESPQFSTASAYGTLLLYGPMAALTLLSCLLFVYLLYKYPILTERK